MRYILILILLINTAYGQGITTFGASRAQDTSKTSGQVRFSAYTGADTTVPVFMPNGTIKQVSKSYFSSGGSSFDSTKYVKYTDTSRNGIVVTYWVLDSTNKKNVPYTGATGNVNLGAYGITSKRANLDTLEPNSSAGLHIHNASHQDIMIAGAGGGQNLTVYAPTNFDLLKNLNETDTVATFGSSGTIKKVRIGNVYTPQSRTININGTTQDLSANRTYTIPVLDTSIITVWADTLDKVATKWDVDSVENALKYIQLNNITTSSPTFDYIIRDGDTSSWAQEYRETGNCVWWAKVNKWVYVYAGFIPPYTGNNIYLGIMTSSDLKTWTDLGKISTRSMEDPYILVSPDSLHIYAEDKEDVPFRNIRLITTADLLSFQDRGDVLDIGTSGSWDEGDVSSPVVKQIGDTIYMWYEGRGTGNGGAIGIAKSTNKYTWTKYSGNPVIKGNQMPNPTFSWATHVVCHDIDIVNDEIYLFCTPYVTTIPAFVSSIALGNVRNIYQYKDYLGTWLPRRRDMNGGGMKTWVNNRYILFGVDTSATKINTLKFTSVVNGDFVNKPIITDDSIRGRYLNIKNTNGFTSVIKSIATTNRADTMPDKSGTIAMTSDIPDVTAYKQKNDSTGNTGYVPQYQLDTAKNNIRIGMAATYLPKADTAAMLNNYLRKNVATATYIPYTGAISNVDLGLFNLTVGGTATIDTLQGGTGSGNTLQLLSTAHATKGLIRFGANSYFDDVNNRFIVGSNTTPTNLTLGAAVRALFTNSGANSILNVHASGGNTIFASNTSGGTSSSPTALANGSILTQFTFNGYDGSSYQRTGEIRVTSTEAWTSSAWGTSVSWTHAATGSNSRVERFGITGTGDVVLNSGGGNTIAQTRLIAGSTTYTGNGRAIQATGRIGASDTIYTATRMQEAGVTSGIIKADANGVHEIATAGTDYVSISGSETLTNKTLTTPVISSITNTGTLTLPTVTSTVASFKTSSTSSSATPAPTGDAKENLYQLTALATAPTFSAPSGTPADGNTLLIRIKDNGTARALSWNAIYRGGTSIALPSTTVLSKTMYVQFIYNSADSKWDLIGLTDGL